MKEVFKDFESSNVDQIIYVDESKEMSVQFSRKKDDVRPKYEYVYKEINREDFELILEAESVGSVLRKVIKGKEFDKLLLEESE